MGEMAILRVGLDLVEMGPCWNCGIVYAVPAHFKKVRRDDNAINFFCPNGHSAVFKDSAVDQLRRQLEAAKGDAEWARRGRDKAQRSAAAYKGKVTLIKNRVKNGVCPCCNRSFENLARHMKTKHPEFDPENADT